MEDRNQSYDGTSKSLELILISLWKKRLADDKWKSWKVDGAQVEAVISHRPDNFKLEIHSFYP